MQWIRCVLPMTALSLILSQSVAKADPDPIRDPPADTAKDVRDSAHDTADNVQDDLHTDKGVHKLKRHLRRAHRTLDRDGRHLKNDITR